VSTIYQLHIELAGSHPTIWRRVTLPGDTPFDQLHDIIQIAMGWQDEHPYEFIVNKTRVHDFGADIDDGENPYDRDTMDAFLDELVTKVKTRFTYNLDDRWQHKITLEEILNLEEMNNDKDEIPVCIDGEGVCPPNDADGFSQQRDITNPEYQQNVARFNKDEVNAELRRYHEEWDEIYAEAAEAGERAEQYDEYEKAKHLRSPQDLLNDEPAKQKMQNWLDAAAIEKNSLEKKTFDRLVNHGYGADESWGMIREVFAIEMFYELKFGTFIIERRYENNLQQLPQKPVEMPSLQCALEVLDTTVKGIPFAAIEYLYNDTTPESRTAIVKALHNVSSQEYPVEHLTSLWYACAAEGHLCEELIDPLIALYDDDLFEDDRLYEQGRYLIGKLAQKYPATAVQKVLTAMEQEAEDSHGRGVYFLFDVFDFGQIEHYKDRLLMMLKHETSYHNLLASTIAHLQIKEGLPILKEQLKRRRAEMPKKGTMAYGTILDIEEAIEQLETGVDLDPEINMPLCLSRGKTWREQFADIEKSFYDTEDSFGDNFDETDPDFDSLPQFDWAPQLPIVKENKTGRNDPCPCGSGKKYKKCCLDKDLLAELGKGDSPH
jgi:hypothetical protein